jgi:hypothetical protein
MAANFGEESRKISRISLLRQFRASRLAKPKVPASFCRCLEDSNAGSFVDHLIPLKILIRRSSHEDDH